MVGRHLVGARHDARRVLGDVDAARRVGAVVVQHRAAHAEDAAVAVDAELHVPDLVALLRRGREVLAPVLDPLDRRAELQRRRRHRDVLGIEHELGSEPAADVGRDDAGVGLAAPEEPHQRAVRHVRHLRPQPHRQQVLERVVARHHAAPLDRHAEALVDRELARDRVRRARQRRRRVAVAGLELGDDVVRRVLVGERRAGPGRRLEIRRDGQRIERRRDQRRGVLGDIAVLGDDDGDRLADMADLAVREDRPVAGLAVVLARHAHGKRGGREKRCEIRHREHAVHAGQRPRGGGVDGADAGVRQGAPDEGGVQHAGKADVVGEAAAAREQRRILDAADGLAERAGGGDRRELGIGGQAGLLRGLRVAVRTGRGAGMRRGRASRTLYSPGAPIHTAPPRRSPIR